MGRAVAFVCFVMILGGLMLAHILIPDLSLSISERRKLQPLPPLNADTLFAGDYLENVEKYLLDHFPFRDAFRTVKAYSVYRLFLQKDNNNIYFAGKHIVKLEYPLRENAIRFAAGKMNDVIAAYLHDKNVYYSVIPDKNYYAAPLGKHLALDYAQLVGIMNENVMNGIYIDIISDLSLGDYYLTDLHWKQERLEKVTNRLLQGMGKAGIDFAKEYQTHEIQDFYGAYYGQAAMVGQGDVLRYLSNDMLSRAEVYDHAAKSFDQIYRLEGFYGTDPYDLFLAGARPLLTVYNPDNPEGRELLLFRDSFGSSIAPLLLARYGKITLIDLRYVTSRVLDEYIDFSQEQDVLFLYSGTILNNGYMIK